jgi:hypothetical protein
MTSAKRVTLLVALMAALGLPLLTELYSADAPAALATPQSLDGIGDTAARSAALFTEAGKVLTSARCVNCHPIRIGIWRPARWLGRAKRWARSALRSKIRPATAAARCSRY